jgi:crotonobetainyl-CoA:carnitine CoA-transferase CaiB-like acyl-CoA transferase
LAVSLPRGEDLDLVPAWLELDDVPPHEAATWRAVARAVAERDGDALVARAALLGLPVSRVGEAGGRAGVTPVRLGDAAPLPLQGLVVVDLSALWAGPLCGDLLAGAGADVVKVESSARPDGARRGPPAFFDLLNGRKRSVVLDFGDREGRRLLRGLVGRADVVIEASRPRALAQLGIDVTAAGDDERAGGPQVWISITGHGRSAAADRDRVAFGDDAAAGGGLVVWEGDAPRFCADAAADPLSGLRAARACLDALREGGRWLLDVSMADVSAELAGPTLAVLDQMPVAEPRARRPHQRAPAAGAQTAEVLAELGLGGG